VGRAKEYQKIKVASRSNDVNKAKSLSESRLSSNSAQAGGYFSCRKRCEETENFAPLSDGRKNRALPAQAQEKNKWISSAE
jgi:hypothetical protein